MEVNAFQESCELRRSFRYAIFTKKGDTGVAGRLYRFRWKALGYRHHPYLIRASTGRTGRPIYTPRHLFPVLFDRALQDFYQPFFRPKDSLQGSAFLL
jgi:hypothetical protein